VKYVLSGLWLAMAISACEPGSFEGACLWRIDLDDCTDNTSSSCRATYFGCSESDEVYCAGDTSFRILTRTVEWLPDVHCEDLGYDLDCDGWFAAADCSGHQAGDQSPAYCLDKGKTCNDSGECCSGNCTRGLCVDSSCVSEGYSCSDSADCCSALCERGVCYGCIRISSGESCVIDTDCCGYAGCLGGTCGTSGCLDTGSACTNDDECCMGPGGCHGGLCCIGSGTTLYGQPCNDDEDCCSRVCTGIGLCI